MWYLYALTGPATWALLNHLDKYLLGRFFKDDAAGPVLVVFTGFSGIVVAVAILLLGPSVFTLAPWQACLLVGAGVLLVGSYIPYMMAMQQDEASIVASLYRLGPLFVGVLSYLALDEKLQPNQITGGIVTIIGSAALVIDFDAGRRGLVSSTFFLMSAACFMNAGTVVIFKFVALTASFWSSAFWEYIGTGLCSLALTCTVTGYRRALLELLGSRQAYVLVPITLSGEVFNLLANLAVGFAGLSAPLGLVAIVTGLHPFFLLFYGILLTLLFPAFSRERLSRRRISRKLIAIVVMCAGIVITFAD
jgi:uncharacterized membrane protein